MDERAEKSFLAAVRALYARARETGDTVMAALCKRALLGDAVARGACRRICTLLSIKEK